MVINMLNKSLSLIDERLKDTMLSDIQKNELLEQKYTIAKLKNEYRLKNGGI